MLVYSQLIKAQFELLASDYGSPVRGMVYYNTGSDIVKWYTGAAWKTAMDLDSTQTASGKTFTTPTLTSPVLNTGVSGSAVKDEDNMASDSATHLATQQSIKAYVDTEISAISATGTDTSAKAADYTITDIDNIRTVLMTTSTTDRTVTLPTAADNTHRIITVKKVDSASGTLTLDGEGAETIDGSATVILYSNKDYLTVQCDGSNWHIIDNGIQNRLETKDLASAITTNDTNIIQFSNLVSGKLYRLTATCYIVNHASDSSTYIDVNHNSVDVKRIVGETVDADKQSFTLADHYFTAAATTIQLVARSIGSSANTIDATSSSRVTTWATLEEINQGVSVTTVF